jgi:hypothetical protein
MNVASLSASTKGDSVMKACRIHRFGSPEVITLEDMDKPEPGEGEVLIRIKAAGSRHDRQINGRPRLSDVHI